MDGPVQETAATHPRMNLVQTRMELLQIHVLAGAVEFTQRQLHARKTRVNSKKLDYFAKLKMVELVMLYVHLMVARDTEANMVLVTMTTVAPKNLI